MRKIMFNEHFGLQQSVLDGTKDMTRRVIKGDYVEVGHSEQDGSFIGKTASGDSVVLPRPAYNVGEEVAIAQSYETIGLTFISPPDTQWGCTYEMPGYSNKMFVRADLMPHSISITATKLERLQDISDEDCLREGIHEGEFMNTWDRYYFDEWGDVPNHITFKTPREAFAALIDRISGKGTWQRNPWVYAYEFELLK